MLCCGGFFTVLCVCVVQYVRVSCIRALCVLLCCVYVCIVQYVFVLCEVICVLCVCVCVCVCVVVCMSNVYVSKCMLQCTDLVALLLYTHTCVYA